MNIRPSTHPPQHHCSNLKYQYIFALKHFFEWAIKPLYVHIILTLFLGRTLRNSNRKMLKLESAKVRMDIDSNVREDQKCLINV